MSTEVWVLCTGRNKDSTKLYGVFSTKEKAVDVAYDWLQDESPEDIGQEIEKDYGNFVDIWYEYCWRYDSEISYYTTIEKCQIE
jgi:hypothetical protein